MKMVRALGLLCVSVEAIYFAYGLWWAATLPDLLSVGERVSWGLSLALALLGVGVSAWVLFARPSGRCPRWILGAIGSLSQAVLVVAGIASGESGLLLLGGTALLALAAVGATMVSRRTPTASTA